MRRILGILVLILFMSAAPAVKAARKDSRKAIGIASYYGHEHQGRRMANGHRFNEHKLTAASHSVPLGSRVRVTNLRNHKSVVVTVTDRMPKHNKRIIDLSTAAARALGLIQRGTGRVSVEPSH
jgi:rare lipoprotein A